MAATPPFSRDMASAPSADNSVHNHSTTEKLKQFRHSELIFRFSLVNVLAFGLLGAAWWEGYIDTVLAADQTRLSVAIFICFAVGFLISAKHALNISREIDDLRAGSTKTHDQMQTSQGAFRMRMAQRIAPVRHIANTLVLLGLIGTVLGFIIALSGVDPDTVSDVNSIAPMVSVLIQGMSTALYTTLIGSILNVWLMANYQILTGGTVKLISNWLDQADENA